MTEQQHIRINVYDIILSLSRTRLMAEISIIAVFQKLEIHEIHPKQS